MVAAGFILLFVFAMAFWFSAKRLEQKTTLVLKTGGIEPGYPGL
jgi:hypothetical protein